MPFRDSAGLRYYSFANLARVGVAHGVFTRLGGSSPQPWDSLNVGSMVGDDPQRVAAHLGLAAEAIGLPRTGLVVARQVHGDRIHPVDHVPPRNESIPEADGLVTAQVGIALAMKFADCVPILLFDPIQRVAGIAHAGWRGTVQGVAVLAVKTMQARYGVRPADLLAGIGPSICAEHYRVGDEVVAAARDALGDAAESAIIPMADGLHLDLWAANRILLERAGVRDIEVAGECTAGDTAHWFSHRAEAGRTGRFAAMIGLAP